MNFLYSFIKSHLKSKIIVFMSSCKQVAFYVEIGSCTLLVFISLSHFSANYTTMYLFVIPKMANPHEQEDFFECSNIYSLLMYATFDFSYKAPFGCLKIENCARRISYILE